MRTAQPSRAVLCSHKNETSLYTNVDKSLDTLLGNVIATICIKYFLKRKYSYMFLYAQNSSVRTHENLIPLVMSREGWVDHNLSCPPQGPGSVQVREG